MYKTNSVKKKKCTKISLKEVRCEHNKNVFSIAQRTPTVNLTVTLTAVIARKCITLTSTNNITIQIRLRLECSKCQAVSSRFLSPFRLFNFFFISSNICSNDMSSFRRTGNAGWPWKALSVYLASRPSVRNRNCILKCYIKLLC